MNYLGCFLSLYSREHQQKLRVSSRPFKFKFGQCRTTFTHPGEGRVHSVAVVFSRISLSTVPNQLLKHGKKTTQRSQQRPCVQWCGSPQYQKRTNVFGRRGHPWDLKKVFLKKKKQNWRRSDQPGPTCTPEQWEVIISTLALEQLK